MEDSQAEYRLSQGLARRAACSPTIRPWLYQAPDYERTMLHHYLALNYLQRGMPTAPW